MSNTLEQLKLACQSTAATLAALKEARKSKRRELLEAEEKRIDLELTLEFAENEAYVGKAASEACLAYIDALEAHALTGAGCGVPLGTKLVHWERKGTFALRSQPLEISEYGIVEAIIRSSDHPANRADYSRADVGSFVIRILKNDGTPGVKYRKMGAFSAGLESHDPGAIPHGWHPEGVDPNKKGGERA